ncbi:hypothetical protein HYT17_02430 [Candidatus Microgenomates bacterium]|nr:hypothetical protein [Candidatus Microgenomates bacterium]
MTADLIYIFSWWSVLFLIGIIFLPLTTKIFANFFDRGYIFSKILGMLIVSYAVFLLGTLKILPFTQITIITVITGITILCVKVTPWSRWNLLKASWKIFLLEETLFLTALFFWAFIRGFEPSIHGLEKYMDFGFVNSILRADYFPAKDLWLSPFGINYYYFGHVVTAVLTKLSGINSVITFNLMIATLFAFTFTGAFSIGYNLIAQIKLNAKRYTPYAIIGGLLTAFLVTLAGNLHTIYAFFSSYNPDSPVPFWQLSLNLNLSGYWYPNATRFIPFTIHEFPLYSFVVSDLHGHVLDIPFVLLTIALLLNILISKSLNIFRLLLLAFLLAVMYMTNAWDGIIYAGLTGLVFLYLAYRSSNYTLYAIRYMLIIVGSILFSLPFSLNFKPFVSAIGIVRDQSPLYMLVILWGFFYFFVISFAVFIFRKVNAKRSMLYASDIFVIILMILSTLLIIIPEFFYAKDIYPAHYRANTMFKLGYQAFIMLSIATGYIIIKISNHWKLVVFAIGSIGLLLVSIYSFFAVNSYYGGLKNYQGLNGIGYLKNLYPTDYEAILWLRETVFGQPVLLEAAGDSYTDYARVSANTGLPTVIGWPVHEWLWRGTYEVAAPRIADVETIYESPDINLTKQLLKKYNRKSYL